MVANDPLTWQFPSEFDLSLCVIQFQGGKPSWQPPGANLTQWVPYLVTWILKAHLCAIVTGAREGDSFLVRATGSWIAADQSRQSSGNPCPAILALLMMGFCRPPSLQKRSLVCSRGLKFCCRRNSFA